MKKGEKMTQKQKEKISKANKGKKFSESHKQKLKISRKKRITKEETKIKMRKAMLAKWKDSDYIEKVKISLKGKQKTKKEVAKRSGENHYNWKGGITPIIKKIRNSKEYKLWRKSVFERDDYTCVFCGKRGGNINADHIKPFSMFPELRFAIDNGRTLCEDCHKKTETFGINAKKYGV